MSQSNDISVVVIAHNEEQRIGACLKSLERQSLQPKEILVIAHNCSDRTEVVAREFPGITLVSFNAPAGTLFPRQEGFARASGSIIASIDGDSVAEPSWLENLVAPLSDHNIAACGGRVVLTGPLWAHWVSWHFFILKPLYRPDYRFYFWGANFACRKKDYEALGGFMSLEPLKKDLDLTRWVEDLYLSLRLEELGRVVFVPSAKVWSPGESFSIKTPVPRDNLGDRAKLYAWLKSQKLGPWRTTQAGLQKPGSSI